MPFVTGVSLSSLHFQNFLWMQRTENKQTTKILNRESRKKWLFPGFTDFLCAWTLQHFYQRFLSQIFLPFLDHLLLCLKRPIISCSKCLWVLSPSWSFHNKCPLFFLHEIYIKQNKDVHLSSLLLEAPSSIRKCLHNNLQIRSVQLPLDWDKSSGNRQFLLQDQDWLQHKEGGVNQR